MSKKNRLKFSTEVEVSDVYNTLTKNYIEIITDYFELQRIWLNNAYVTFKDLDKYVVLIYLIRDNWVTLSGKFQYQSMDEFYDTEGVSIDKINLIQISNDLNIPKHKSIFKK